MRLVEALRRRWRVIRWMWAYPQNTDYATLAEWREAVALWREQMPERRCQRCQRFISECDETCGLWEYPNINRRKPESKL